MIDRTAITKAREDPAFGDEGWLTFYLAGDPSQHAAMKPGLQAMKAVNLSGAEGGFVYAKIPVELDESEITQRVSQVRSLAEQSEIRIDIIDLDATAYVTTSNFYTLWTETRPN